MRCRRSCWARFSSSTRLRSVMSVAIAMRTTRAVHPADGALADVVPPAPTARCATRRRRAREGTWSSVRRRGSTSVPLGIRRRRQAVGAQPGWPTASEAIDALEGPVGEEDLVVGRIGHVHRRIKAVEHRHETLMGRFKLSTHPLRFGDVGDRRHPAGLPPFPVDQRRQVEAGIETLVRFLRRMRISKPVFGALPARVSSRLCACKRIVAYPAASKGKGAREPTSSSRDQPVMRQKAGFT